MAMRPLVSSFVVLAAACATTDTPPAAKAQLNESTPVIVTEPLLRWVPRGAEAIAIIDHAQVRGRSWVRTILSGTPSDRERQRKERGFVELDDADRSLTAAFPSPDGSSSTAGASLEILTGRFDGERLDAAWRARHPDTRAERWRGRAVLVAANEQAQTLADERTLLSGPFLLVRQALDCAEGAAADVSRAPFVLFARQGLAERWQGGRPALELWVDGTPGMRDRLARALDEGETLRWFGVRLGGEDALRVRLVGQADGASEARDLAARLRAHLTALKRRPIAEALGLEAIVGHLHIGSDEDRLLATLDLPAQVWEDFQVRLSTVSAQLRAAQASEPEPQKAATPPL